MLYYSWSPYHSVIFEVRLAINLTFIMLGFYLNKFKKLQTFRLRPNIKNALVTNLSKFTTSLYAYILTTRNPVRTCEICVISF